MARQALGKGLDALIPGASKKKEGIFQIKIEDVKPNKSQPREKISSEKLEELINSIKNDGVIQPIIVKEAGNNKYEIIAGERRYIAAQRAGLKYIPAVIRNVSTTEQYRLALIENIHRENLNPVEEAKAYYQLMNLYKCTQEELAEKIGKNRATIANSLRLLKLPKEIQEYIIEEKIYPGHAKLLLSIENPEKQKE